MANSITKFKAYIDKLDTVYQQASATSILDADADTVRMGAKAGEFLIPKMSMDGLADYSRSSGYVKPNRATMTEVVSSPLTLWTTKKRLVLRSASLQASS